MVLRPAQPGDEMAVAQVHVRSWQVGYRTLLPDHYLDQLRPEDRAARYTFGSLNQNDPFTLVAIQTGIVRGFATTAPSRDPDLGAWGELCAIYVDPEFWGCGLGAALASAARSHLVEAGFRSAFLWVMAGNERAQRFYKLDGWAPDGESRTENVWGIDVDSVRYRRNLVPE
jgi:ribosomal protein S18 acetylase RimI-like enzyme